ncbi:MAG: DUF421 domain-containing protein [Gemmatimonadaceae bacterium]
MDTVIRATAVYLVMLLIFRISGKRTLAQITTFDLVLTLVISECIQQALIGEDSSVTNAVLLITTMVGLDILLSLWKQRSKAVEKILDGVPLVLIENGELHQDRLDRERVDEEDILSAARELQGLERIEQIKHAVLERSGHITIIPRAGRA